jgi:epoxyqueuosine reductase
MHYLERSRALRRDPAQLPGPGRAPVRTLILLAARHPIPALPPAARHDPARGLIAAYAWGDDYHDVLRPRLHTLDAFLRAQTGRTTLAKGLVDSGPLLERDWAQVAQLGFFGKNCCIIHPQFGSWLLLAALLVPELLANGERDATPPQTEPPVDALMRGVTPAADYGAWAIPLAEGGVKTTTCGRCTRCLDGCPTNAFVGPFHLDPQRCISYWTIETQAPIPLALRPRFGNRIFGCDVCQDVCPWNARLDKRAPAFAALRARPERMAAPLLEGFDPATPYWLEDEAFAKHFARSPVLRATRAGMLRNVCVALGNWGSPAALPALTQALNDAAPPARGHAAWALGQVGQKVATAHVVSLLQAQLAAEDDAWVRSEITQALDTVA